VRVIKRRKERGASSVFTYFIDRINTCTGDIVIRGECIITITYVVADEKPRWSEAGSRISAAASSEAASLMYIYHAVVVQPDML
jgi:hypothetical protein